MLCSMQPFTCTHRRATQLLQRVRSGATVKFFQSESKITSPSQLPVHYEGRRVPKSDPICSELCFYAVWAFILYKAVVGRRVYLGTPFCPLVILQFSVGEKPGPPFCTETIVSSLIFSFFWREASSTINNCFELFGSVWWKLGTNSLCKMETPWNFFSLQWVKSQGHHSAQNWSFLP